MSGIIEISDFEQDVTEYKMMNKTVLENFIHGVIKLGEILARQRDKWKPQKKWREYMEALKISPSIASFQIRTYEYSLGDMATLLKANAQNFQQLIAFLQLDDEAKEALGEVVGGEALTTTEFMDKVDQVIMDPTESPIPELIVGDDFDFSEMLEASAMADIPFMAKQILNGINKTGKLPMNKHCLPVIEAFLHSQQSVTLIQKGMDKLDEAEREFWTQQMVIQIEKLNKLKLLISK